MAWLPVILGALALWLGYILWRSWGMVKKGRQSAEGLIFLLMGSQAAAAEWFLESVYLAEGVKTGRLEVAVAVEKSSDDTAGIVEILSGKKGFSLVDPVEWPVAGRGIAATAWHFDVRGMGFRQLLEGPLRSLRAL